ncbi:uncharacterized protein LOC115424936 isoform X3 [Sphaeramia orbicularis]|uniref:uncharacterized protein LOC115424936 isoform X3 n=1 Tax=Sphaeramia orbicularis TaxID=375764 RepID=UPI00117BEA5C|nr:uncharacterized protein LOC115424936 isoform X3 [Sphaeramia orbicularis]
MSRDDGGPWMKMNPVTKTTDGSQVVTSDDRPQDETKVVLPVPPALVTRYYSVMEDEGADDVFIPSSLPRLATPSCIDTLLPQGDSSGATVNNSSVTLSNGSPEGTEAKANPDYLDWHCAERELMDAQNDVDEVLDGTSEASKGCTNNNNEESTQPTGQDQTSMEAVETPAVLDQDITTGDKGLKKELEGLVILSKEQESQRESDVKTEKYLNPENEKHFDIEVEKKEKRKSIESVEKLKDIHPLEDMGSKETDDCHSLKRPISTLSGYSVNDNDFESCRPPELYQCNQNQTDATANKSPVSEIQQTVSSDNQEHVDTTSFNYNITRYDWVRTSCSTSQTPESQCHISEPLAHSDEQKELNEQQDAEGPQGCESSKIATGIQQGEQLLQRLQLVQQRQDTHLPESKFTQQVVKEVRIEQKIVINLTEGWDLAGENAKEENRVNAVNVKAEKTILKVKDVIDDDSKDQETKAKTSSSTAQLEDNSTDNKSYSEQSDKWMSADLPSINTTDASFTHIPFLTCHRFSAAETSMERQLHEVTQRKQNLQRAEGTFNLAENPDVLEIPFKSNISLEPLPTEGLQKNWQFSEQKMQKEISKEIQKELVLVNQGKIPGSYSKGETRHLKDTKLLFEAFHQDNTEGPTRHRKPPSLGIKGLFYPSVLERTQSLETFSLKSCPVSRAHSLRLYKSVTAERQKSLENLRSKSPNGGSRDKTRLYPYPKQEKHMRLYRSMDSINADDSTAVDAKRNTQNENTRVESPILKQNPFFKLRPALSLQPEVERDIREAKKREEELRRQRKTLYGENWQKSEDEEKLTFTSVPDVRHQSWRKLERVWPPPSKKDQVKSEQTQEPKLQWAGGQKAALWQRWESGQINGQTSKENK